MEQVERDNWIRMGLDPTPYENLNKDQAEQVRYGLMNGVDVSVYADKRNKPLSMMIVRQALEHELPYRYIDVKDPWVLYL